MSEDEKISFKQIAEFTRVNVRTAKKIKRSPGFPEMLKNQPANQPRWLKKDVMEWIFSTNKLKVGE